MSKQHPMTQPGRTWAPNATAGQHTAGDGTAIPAGPQRLTGTILGTPQRPGGAAQAQWYGDSEQPGGGAPFVPATGEYTP